VPHPCVFCKGGQRCFCDLVRHAARRVHRVPCSEQGTRNGKIVGFSN
jgi:hypothetical protein